MCICEQLPFKVEICGLCGKGRKELLEEIDYYFSNVRIIDYQRYLAQRQFKRRTSVPFGAKLGMRGYR